MPAHRAFAHPAVLLAVVSSVGAAALLPTAEPVQTLEVDEYLSVQPVLIRNEINAIDRLTITKAAPGLHLKSLSFDFRGTDAIHDIDVVELFTGDANGGLSPSTRFGQAQSAAEVVTFTGDLPVTPGSRLHLSVRLKAVANPDHSISARLDRVLTSEGGYRSPHAARTLRRHIGLALRKHDDAGVYTHRIPALATTRRGSLLCVYDLRRRAGRDLQEDIDIGLSRSTDGGRTWESPRVIMDMGTYGGLPQEQNGCSDPGIIVDRETGEIFCFAVWMWGKPGKHQWTGDGSEPGYEIGRSAQLLMVRSKDDGKSWSNPENLTRLLKKPEWWLLTCAPQQGIQLPDGTLVMPMQGRDARGWDPLESTCRHASLSIL